MAWTTVAEADVKAGLSSAELEACRSQIAEGDSDPLAGIIADTIAEVRGYILTQYDLAASGIPSSLKNAAVDICIYRLLKRFKIDQDEQRKAANDAAIALLIRVSEGKFGIEDSADPTTSTETSLGPSYVERTEYNEIAFNRETQDGL